MSNLTPADVHEASAWIRDLVYLAFPEGAARERALFDLIKQFSRFKLMILNGYATNSTL